MKNILFLFTFLILFQSCFSYKTVNYNSILIGKKQKFEIIKYDVSKPTIEGRLVSENEETMIFDNNGERYTVLKDEIYEVKIREFSFYKTVFLIGSAFATYILFSVFLFVSTFP